MKQKMQGIFSETPHWTRESARNVLTLSTQNDIFYGHGEMSEGFKEPVLKTGDTATYRGFESHSLRQTQTVCLCSEQTVFVLIFQIFNLNSFRKQIIPRLLDPRISLSNTHIFSALQNKTAMKIIIESCPPFEIWAGSHNFSRFLSNQITKTPCLSHDTPPSASHHY